MERPDSNQPSEAEREARWPGRGRNAAIRPSDATLCCSTPSWRVALFPKNRPAGARAREAGSPALGAAPLVTLPTDRHPLGRVQRRDRTLPVGGSFDRGLRRVGTRHEHGRTTRWSPTSACSTRRGRAERRVPPTGLTMSKGSAEVRVRHAAPAVNSEPISSSAFVCDERHGSGAVPATTTFR
jgi:hypothetical protein